MKNVIKLISTFVMTMILGWLAACSSVDIQDDQKISVVSVKFSKNELTLIENFSETVQVSVLPANADDRSFEISVNDTTSVSYKLSGNSITITANKATGEEDVVFTVRSNDGKLTDTLKVKVVPPVHPDSVDVDQESLDEEGNFEIGRNSTLVLPVSLSPADTTYTDLVLTGYDKEMIAVEQTKDGLSIRGLKNGSTSVSLVPEDNENGLEPVVVPVVVKEIYAESLSIKDVGAINPGKTGTFKAEVLPANASEQSVTWTSSNPELLQVDAVTGDYWALKSSGETVTVTAVSNSENPGGEVLVTKDVKVVVPYAAHLFGVNGAGINVKVQWSDDFYKMNGKSILPGSFYIKPYDVEE